MLVTLKVPTMAHRRSAAAASSSATSEAVRFDAVPRPLRRQGTWDVELKDDPWTPIVLALGTMNTC